MKKHAVLLFSLLLLLALCACGRADAGAGETAAPVTLNVVTSFGGEDGNRKAFEAAVSAYESSTGNRVNDGSDVSSEEWKAKVLTDFETGSEPDVLFYFTNADAEPFIKAGKVVSLEEIRTEYPDYAKNMDDRKLPIAYDGKCYAVPLMGYWEYLFVNQTVLDACGVDMPGNGYTWQEFLADCSAIRSNGYIPIACSLVEMPHYWFEFAVLNNGGVKEHMQVPTLDGSGRLEDTPAARAWTGALEDISLLYSLGYFPENTLTAGDAETVAMFGDGEAAFLIDGSWKVGFFSENYADHLSDYAVRYVPSKGTRISSQTIGGISTGYFITRKTWNDPEKRAAAVEFVSQLTSDAVVERFVTTEITALKTKVRPEGLNALYESAAQANGSATMFVGSVQDVISGEARSALFAAIPDVVSGKLSARDAIEQALRLN